jgi:hypothetical protein
MDAVETYGDPDLLIIEHLTAAIAHFFLGEPIKTREHADRVLALYSKEQHVSTLPLSTGRGSSRRNPANCAPRRAMRG